MLIQFFRKSLNLLLAVCLLAACQTSQQPSQAAQTSQAPAVTQFTYDPNGNFNARIDANGVTTKYEYDALNRLSAARYSDNSAVTFAYDQLGQRLSMTDALGVTLYEYDIHGRVTKVTDPNKYSLQYKYDPRGLLSQLVYPDGSTTTFTWDGNSQLVAVEDGSGNTQYSYDLAGKLTKRILPNDVTTIFEYDNASRLINIRHTAASGSVLLAIGYELDAGGNRTKMTRTDEGKPAQVTSCVYDNLSRLVKVTYADGEVVDYQYDATGNRTVMDSSKSGSSRYTYNGLGQLTQLDGPKESFTFQYDANGNLTERVKSSGWFSRETTKFTWDNENRLTAVDDGKTKTTFGYDGDGRRLVKNANGQKTDYIQHGALLPQVLLEITGGQTTRSLPGQPRVGEAGLQGERFYLEDGLGSVVGETDTSGKLIGTGEYDVFGAPRGSSSLLASFSFTGEKTDPETGLVFLRARFYDPQLGRFISQDPYPPSLENPQTLNRYVYVGNNPVNLTDPKGLAPWSDWNPYETPFIPDISRLSDQSSNNIWSSFSTQVNWVKVAKIAVAGVGVVGSIAGVGTGVGIIVLGGPVGWGVGGIEVTQSGLGVLSNGAKLINAFKGQDIVHVYPGGLGEAIIGGKAGEITDLGFSFATGRFEKGAPTLLSHVSDFATAVDAVNSTGESVGTIYKSLSGMNGANNTGGDSFGGVSLDQAAKVMADLNDISGATYDPKTGQIILIGRKDISLPPMNMDDLAVAIRSVYGGENPGVTMVPIDPSMKNITQKVEYFGAVENTHFGMVMFEADRYLKSMAAGKDTLTGEAVNPNVPGFKSEMDLSLEQRNSVPWHRNWFVPGQIVLKKSPDGKSMLFDQATIKLESRFIEFMPDGSQKDVVGSSPVTDQFTKFVNEHYSELATGKPELAELVRLAKIVGIVRWLHDNNIPIDLSWVGRYKVAQIETPSETPGVISEKNSPDGSYKITSMGGVDYSTQNSYAPDNAGESTALTAPAVAARPVDQPVSWDFQYYGETLTGVALNLTPSKIIGGYSANWTDMSIPLSAGLDASFTRQYNSLDIASGLLGRGWSQALPSLVFRQEAAPDDPNSYFTRATLTMGGSQAEFTQNSDGFFHPDDPAFPNEVLGLAGEDGFKPVGVPEGFQLLNGLPGQPLEFANSKGQRLQYNGFAMLVNDGSTLAFDPSGRISGLQSFSGSSVNYQYAGEHLSAIVDGSGRGIRFTYNTTGLLTDLAASDGRAIHYAYSPLGDLSGVSDNNQALYENYIYDSNGHLSQITDGYGNVMGKMTYDEMGRVTSSQSGYGSATVHFDDKANTVLYTDASGNSLARQYDDHKNILSETDPWGKAVQYQYDQSNQIVSVTDRNNNKTTISHNEGGFIDTITTPDREQTRFLNYNKFGLPQANIDPASDVTFFEYDDHGRLVGMKNGYHIAENSTGDNLQYSEIDPLSVSYQYDPAGNLAAEKDAAGFTTNYTHDQYGNLTDVQLPGGGLVKKAFDDYSRLKTITDPTGLVTNFEYNPQGQLANLTSPAGKVEYQYTAGQLTAVTGPQGHIIRYGYNPAANLTSVTEPDNTVTKYEYDASGKLTAVVNGLGGRIAYLYDALGRVIEISFAQAAASSASGGTSNQGNATVATVAKNDLPTSFMSVNNPMLWLILGIGVGILLVGIVISLVIRSKNKRLRKQPSQRPGIRPR